MTFEPPAWSAFAVIERERDRWQQAVDSLLKIGAVCPQAQAELAKWIALSNEIRAAKQPVDPPVLSAVVAVGP